jgi:hypothetical protein
MASSVVNQVHHSHHSHHIHIPHNHHWHHRHHRHHFHLAAIVSNAVDAVKNAVNVVYNAVAGALCNLGQAFMDSVVRTVVVGAMEVGKTVLITAGKVVAQGIATIGGAIDKVFSVQRIYYAGSLAAAAMGNFGTLEIDLTVFATKVKYIPLLTPRTQSAALALSVSARSASVGHLCSDVQLEGRVRHRRHDQGARYGGQGCRCAGHCHFQVDVRQPQSVGQSPVCQCDSQCCRQGKMQYVTRMVRFLSSMRYEGPSAECRMPHRGCHLHQSARGPVSARAWPAAGAATAQSTRGSHRPARGRPSAPSPVLLQPRIAEDRTAACELHCGLPGNHSIVSPAMRPDLLRIGSRGPGVSPIRPEAGIGVPAGGGGPGTRGLSPAHAEA